MPAPTDPTKTPPSDSAFDDGAGRLLAAAERIMQAIARDPEIDLGRPEDLLALQLLGPCLNRAMGMDDITLTASNASLVEMSMLIDVEQLRILLRAKGTQK